MSRMVLLVVLLALTCSSGAAQNLYPLQTPTISATQIAFVYAGDIWTVERAGGQARPLLGQKGEKVAPVFSPDGSQVAFSMSAGGNFDVYLVASTGGEARRLTYHPKDDVVVGWTPDGKNILFRSRRFADATHELYTIPAQGGFETLLTLPLAWEGAFSPDATRLAYAPLNDPTRSWRNYRGGQTSPLWIADLANSRIEKLPDANANDKNPMWIGKTIYFVSDRAGAMNLFAYDTQTKKTNQLTRFEKYDIKAASYGGGSIVFAQDGAIHLFDLQTNQERPVAVKISGEFAEVKPRTIKAARWLSNFNISPDGSQALFGGRGEVLTVNAATGEAHNLTQSSGIAERSPVYSPDGKSVAYYSDESGEYQLHIRWLGGDGRVKKIAIEEQPSFYEEPVWSPDSRKLAFYDKRLGIWYVDVDTGKARRLDTATRADDTPAPAWSVDSRWLAYTKSQPNYLRALYLYSLDTEKRQLVSDPRYDADSPAFDKNGRYLYFTASANAGPRRVFGMASFVFRTLVTRSVQAVVLRKSDVSPLAAPQAAGADRQGASGIDPEGIGGRIVRLPLPLRDYLGLATGKPGVLFILEAGNQSPNLLHKFDLATRQAEKFLEGVNGFVVCEDGSKLLYVAGGNYALASTEAPLKAGTGRLDLSKVELPINPREEWRQIYHEAWRLMRDYFYDANLHGQNLAALKAHYAAYLPNVVTRNDLNYVFREMFSHMTVSHMQIGGGDAPGQGSANVGLLGADVAMEQGRYRLKKIYRGDNSDPLQTAPLAQPGLQVNEGDYLIAIDGEEIKASENFYKYFQGKGGRSVQLTIAANADGGNARNVTVVPVPGENTLRLVNWMEENRRKVEALSGGKLGYIYLPDTGQAGYNLFNRDFYASLDKQGLIIDERFNSGGAPADYFIDLLNRASLSAYLFREGEDMKFPVAAVAGPKVMIINEYAGSGGDTLPWMFRQAGVGTIVGKRTWGGGIGGFVRMPGFIDGGSMLAPNRAFYNPKTGAFDIENHGVAPDIEVDFTPALVRQGHDPQLEKAVQVALENLQKSKVLPPKKPHKAVYR